MYNEKTNIYTCDFCDIEMEWDQEDDIHGDMWSCENCGNNFCSKCFIDKYGQRGYFRMMQGSDLIFCPDCYEEVCQWLNLSRAS